MVTLSRLVRFAVNPHDPHTSPLTIDNPNTSNGFAGVPAMRGLGRFYELEILCRGEPDPATGYFLDIKVIDRAARQTIIPAISRACDETPMAEPAAVLAAAMPELNSQLQGTLHSVRWLLSPFYSVELAMTSINSAASAGSVAAASTPSIPSTRSPVAFLRQRFEIAAAHRLHAPALSDEQNRAYFGKCNNPSGHGHNYVIEPCVAVRVNQNAGDGTPLTVAMLEDLVDQAIIQPYDHKNFNLDTPAFDQSLPGGVNPSVENIARVFFEALAPLVALTGAQLHSLRVWETEKTSASYPSF